MDEKYNDGMQDLEKLGDRIQDIIESAVSSKDYSELSQSVTRTVNAALNNGGNKGNGPVRASERVKNSGQGSQVKSSPAELYENVNTVRLKGLIKTVIGGILTGGMGMATIFTTLVQLLLGGSVFGVSLIFLAGALGGGYLLYRGLGDLGRTGRFQKYVKALGDRTYCKLELLAAKVNKQVKFVKKDVQDMIGRGWFREGHLDREETCLITDDETYRQYQQTQKQLEQRQEALKQQEENRKQASPEVQDILKKGDAFLEKIRKSNDAIPGEEMSAKISRMEQIIRNIFDRVEAHPEVVRDLKRLMDYYLPMTVKLLDAYEEMDKQPVQGENILHSKKEIEDTLDMLNEAFARILDSIFQDTAWDVSSDISVLQTVLAQEGLAGEDFKL